MESLTEKSQLFQELFYWEESKGEKIVNYTRLFICLVFCLYTLSKVKTLQIPEFTLATKLSLSCSSFVLFYSGVLLLLFQKNIYHKIIKYISITIEVLFSVLILYVYKLEPPAVYAKIYFLAHYSLVYIFIFLAIMRYNSALGIYAGVLAAGLYYVFIIHDNYMTDLNISFMTPDGNSHVTAITYSDSFINTIYLLIMGVIASIVTINLKRFVIYAVIRENEKYTEQLEESVLTAVNKENKKYLENIKEGLLYINNKLQIEDQYSHSLITLFEHKSVKGLNFIDFIYPDKTHFAEDRKELQKFLTLLFNNIHTDMEMLEEINPLKYRSIQITDVEGIIKDKVIDASFYRLINNGMVEKVLVIIQDKTDIIQAQKQLVDIKEKHEDELENINIILRNDPKSINDFTENSLILINDTKIYLDQLVETPIIDDILNQYQSLKEQSRHLGFNRISDLCNNIENSLTIIRNNKKFDVSMLKKEMTDKIQKLILEFENLKTLKKRYKGFSANVIKNKENTEFFNSLQKLCLDLTVKMEKKSDLKIINNLEKIPHKQVIRNILHHLINNAVEHGIEDSYERIANNKNEIGLIELVFKENDDFHIIEVRDDGMGIDFNRLKQIVIEKKFVPDLKDIQNKSMLLKQLFRSGFSTKNSETKLAGQGTGLSAVVAETKKLNATISVNTAPNKGTIFSIKIPKI